MKTIVTILLAVMFLFAGMTATACVIVCMPVLWAYDSLDELLRDDVPFIDPYNRGL